MFIFVFAPFNDCHLRLAQVYEVGSILWRSMLAIFLYTKRYLPLFAPKNISNGNVCGPALCIEAFTVCLISYLAL